MLKKIYIDSLTQDSVNIKKQDVEVAEGEETPIGSPWRKAYINNITGRVELSNEVAEPFLSQIMAVWGESPTIETEPYITPLPQPNPDIDLANAINSATTLDELKKALTGNLLTGQKGKVKGQII